MTKPKQYRRFCFWCCLPLLGSGMALGLALLLAAGQVVRTHGVMVDMIQRKMALARAIDSPKTVIIAGSNGHYGLRAKRLTAATGRPTINLANNGGLTLDFQFFLARQVVHAGDLVILPLEYHNYYRSSHRLVNTATAGTSLGMGLDYFFHLPWAERTRYVRLVTFAQLWQGVRSRFGADVGPPVLRPLNPWGDELGNISNPRTDALLRENIAYEQQHMELKPLDPDGGRVRSLVSFIRWCQQRSIRVLATWPNAFAGPPFRGPAMGALRADIRAFYDELNVTVVGQAELAAMPRELLFDTIYHPNHRGARLRTRRFIRALAAQTDLCKPYVTPRRGGRPSWAASQSRGHDLPLPRPGEPLPP